MEYRFYRGHKVLTLAVGFLLCLGLLAGCASDSGSTTTPSTEVEVLVPSGVTVNGLDLSGMDREQLMLALAEAAQEFVTGTITVTIEDAQYTLTQATLDPQVDLEAAAEAITNARPGEFILSPYLSLDEKALSAQFADWEAIHTIESVPTAWALEGEMPSLVPTEEEVVCQNLVLTKGTTGKTLDLEALERDIRQAYATRNFEVTGTVIPGEPEEFDILPIHTEVHMDPVDAVMDMTTFQVSEALRGYTFDIEAALAAWEAGAEGEAIRIPMTLVEPEVSTESLTSLLYRDVLGSCSTKHTNDSNRNNNLRLACKALNGKILMPGETFSFNGTLGKRTTEKGYLPAGAYSAGQTITDVGGGICQVSSTLYNAALLSDLNIVYRTNHSMTVSYVKLGMDATVNWNNVDFKFKNSTNYPIRIEASVSGGYVHISIVGTDERDYYVKMTYEVNETIPYDTVYQEMYADNEEGYKDGDVIVSPHTGYKITTYRSTYSKETDERLSTVKEATSKYIKVDKVVAKIIDKPTEPEPTEPKPTDPPPTEHIHSYTETTTSPTCTADGSITYTCSCGHSYTETIPAMGHSYVSEVVEPTETEQGYTLHVCTRCGDSHKDTFVPPLTPEPEPTPEPSEEPEA